MFRKIIHSILAVTLFITTSGFSLSKHYCGTHLVTVAVNTEAKSCCGNNCKSNCCHNETVHYQLKDNFTGSVSTEIAKVFYLDLLFAADFTTLLIDPEYVEKEIIIQDESPPPKSTQTKLSEIQTYLL